MVITGEITATREAVGIPAVMAYGYTLTFTIRFITSKQNQRIDSGGRKTRRTPLLALCARIQASGAPGENRDAKSGGLSGLHVLLLWRLWQVGTRPVRTVINFRGRLICCEVKPIRPFLPSWEISPFLQWTRFGFPLFRYIARPCPAIE